jgi:hypothetical protein
MFDADETSEPASWRRRRQSGPSLSRILAPLSAQGIGGNARVVIDALIGAHDPGSDLPARPGSTGSSWTPPDALPPEGEGAR